MAEPQSSPPAYGHHKTTICHATGSATNPYVQISIPPPAVQAHSRHQDGRDIIPAPQGGCPGAQSATQGTEQGTSQGTTQGTSQPTAQAPALAQQVAGTLAASLPGTTPRKGAAAPRNGVLGVTASSRAADAPARVGPSRAAASRARDDRGLPFTGFEVALAAALGIALLLTGLALKRSAFAKRIRPSSA